MQCYKCKQRGSVLIRVNEKGVKGIWECSPCCGIPFINDETALVYTLTELDQTYMNELAKQAQDLGMGYDYEHDTEIS